jgi:hypothetical protein
MPDAPEIPEAANASDKKIALTIAILAVVLSVVNNLGDNSKTDAIIKTNEASNQWAYFQAKSIKEHMASMHAGLLSELGGASPSAEVRQSMARLYGEVEREEKEKSAIQKQARDLQQQAAQESKINDRCDLSALILQIAIVICSVAILSEWRPFWYVGIVFGVVGTAIGITAFLM